MYEEIQQIIRNNLNDEQYEAATYFGDQDSMIIAGAGSGKTWTLSYKVMNLISKGIQENKICVITFTNKAAKEISQRITKIQNQLGFFESQIHMGTFHSIFFQLLKEIYSKKEEFGLQTEYTKDVGIETNNQMILGLICKEEFGNILQVDYITKLIGEIKNQGIFSKKDIMSFLNSKGSNEEKIYEVYLKYQQMMEKQNLVDFDDILILGLKYSEENEKIKEFIANKFDYICVDEAQDTNDVQFKLLQIFKANITYIGDDFQSIYKFRGAQMKNFLELGNGEDIKKFKLVTNYRSLDHIVQAGNTVIKNNEDQFDKELVSFRGEGKNEIEKKIFIKSYDNQFQESKTILEEIKKIKEEKGYKWSDFAVLYRVNQQSELLERFSKELKIPFVIRTNKKTGYDIQIDIFFSFLKYLQNNKDATSLIKVLKHIYNGQDFYDLFEDITNGNTLDNIVSTKRKSKNEFIQQIISFKNILEKFKEKLVNFNEKNLVLLGQVLGLNYQAIEILRGYYLTWTNDLINKENIKYQDFIERYLLSDQLYEEKFEDSINLMTVHSSKGLEFKYVTIMGMQDGIFPIQRSLKDKIDTEEERRLFYVAITRSKDILNITYSLQTIKNGKLQKSKKSRFLNELGNNIQIMNNTFYNASFEEGNTNTIDLTIGDKLF